MMKRKIWIIIGVVFFVLVAGFLCVTQPWREPLHHPSWYFHNAPGQPDLSDPDRFPSEAQEYKKVTAPLSLYYDKEENATVILFGSVIYHWANGITEVYGPDNKRIFIARDSEATMIAAPGGLKPATHIYYIPSGALVDEAGLPPPSDEGSKITKVYLGGRKILTVIEKSEDFVAVSGGE